CLPRTSSVTPPAKYASPESPRFWKGSTARRGVPEASPPWVERQTRNAATSASRQMPAISGRREGGEGGEGGRERGAGAAAPESKGASSAVCDSPTPPRSMARGRLSLC